MNKDLISTDELRLESIIVFGGASQRGRLTTMNIDVTGNNKTSPIAFDLELNAEPQCTERIKLPEVSHVFSPHDSPFHARKGMGHNLRMWDSETMCAESWISFQRGA
jgi:hypothetical protein